MNESRRSVSARNPQSKLLAEVIVWLPGKKNRFSTQVGNDPRIYLCAGEWH